MKLENDENKYAVAWTPKRGLSSSKIRLLGDLTAHRNLPLHRASFIADQLTLETQGCIGCYVPVEMSLEEGDKEWN